MESSAGGDDHKKVPLLEYRYKDDEDSNEDKPSTSEVVNEAKIQLELGVPVVLMSLLDYSMQIISVAFVGSLGAMNLAGVAMGASFANVFGFAILVRMETSGGQAHGNGQLHLLGYLLQRGQFILSTFCLPIALLYLHAAWVLRQWGQDEEIAELAGQYVMYLLPGLLATALFLPVSKFLQVQEVTNRLNALGFLKDAGLAGCPAAFVNLGSFLSLALAACVMTSFECWVWEIVEIMAGWLPHPDISVSAMTICFQTVSLCFMPPQSLGTAASIRVSNELGAQSLKRRERHGHRHIRRFSTAPGDLRLRQCFKWIFVWVLRGSGQQWTGSLVNKFGLYGVSLPLAYLFGIRMQMGLRGLWWGMLIGVNEAKLVLLL
ncbi:hypothetical protein R1flu_005017 [Riccia fluitans]|uniref:MATE efflux family protein n=1 Tax=Riccia fluitans TaxID=41844 RepID=A0ABD1YSA2_9MARC